MFPLWSLSAGPPPGLHHGLYGPGGTVTCSDCRKCGFSTFAVHHGRRHFLRDAEAHILGLADHGDSTVAVLDRGDRCPWYAGRAGSSKLLPVVCNDRLPSTTAVHQQGRHLPFRGAEAYPHDQAVQQTTEIPLLPYTRWLISLFTGRADFPCRGAEVDSHSPDCCRTKEGELEIRHQHAVRTTTTTSRRLLVQG